MPRAVRLYTLDDDPTHRRATPFLLAQHSDLSLALTLMLCRGPRVTPAVSNVRRRAILAETRDAVTRVLALYDLLGANAALPDRAWFDKGRDAAHEVLTATQFGPYLFLEVDAPNHEVDKLCEQIAGLDEKLTAARGGEATEWIAERAAAWFTEIGMPEWSIPRRFDRAALDAKIKGAKRGYRIASGLDDDQVRSLEYVLPVVIDEVERVADERVEACELSAHPDTPTIELRGTELLIALPPTGWSTFARRRLLDALGMIPPTRMEYARGKV